MLRFLSGNSKAEVGQLSLNSIARDREVSDILKPEAGDWSPQSHCAQYPNSNRHHHDYIQNGLYAGGHGDETID
jgi:hypothetical protein